MATYSVVLSATTRQDAMLSSFISNINTARIAGGVSSVTIEQYMLDGFVINVQDYMRQARDTAANQVAIAWLAASQQLQLGVWSALGLGSALPW